MVVPAFVDRMQELALSALQALKVTSSLLFEKLSCKTAMCPFLLS